VIARRSFLAGILAAGAAPAIARAESLMRVVPVERTIFRFRRVYPISDIGVGNVAIVPADAGKIWEDAIRGATTDGTGWVRVGVDPALDDKVGLALIRGEIGRIDSEVRIIESPIMPAAWPPGFAGRHAASQRELNREYREMLERMPVSRQDFLGEVLQQEVDLRPKAPRISADSVGRQRYRW
jgi:hypothetical protein